MDRGRQAEPGEHLPAPGVRLLFTKDLENMGGRLLFQPFEDQAGACRWLRFEEQMEAGSADPRSWGPRFFCGNSRRPHRRRSALRLLTLLGP